MKIIYVHVIALVSLFYSLQAMEVGHAHISPEGKALRTRLLQEVNKYIESGFLHFCSFGFVEFEGTLNISALLDEISDQPEAAKILNYEENYDTVLDSLFIKFRTGVTTNVKRGEALHNGFPLVQRLMTMGAQPTSSCLRKVIMCTDQQVLPTLEYLLDHGAPLEVFDFHCALYNQHPQEVIALLLQYDHDASCRNQFLKNEEEFRTHERYSEEIRNMLLQSGLK